MKYVENGLEVDLVKLPDGTYLEFEWRDVVGYEGYYLVSNYGHVKSLDRYVSGRGLTLRIRRGKIRKLTLSNSGYLCVGLLNTNGKKNCFVHRLVAESFIEGFNSDLEVDHIDRNRTNNCIINLRSATSSQNNGNSYKRSTASSKYKGVHWCNRLRRWVAKIEMGGNRYSLKSYRYEENAALAYNLSALEVFGEFAAINKLSISDFIPERDSIRTKNRCVDTGKVYNSWVEAANDIGAAPSSISRACRLGKRIKGLLFEIVE